MPDEIPLPALSLNDEKLLNTIKNNGLDKYNLSIDNPAGNSASVEPYLPKYKSGSHSAIPGKNMTITSPTIITSTKGMIER